MATQSRDALLVSFYPSARTFGDTAAAPDLLSQETTVEAEKFPCTWVESAGKRCFDLVAVSLGIVAFAPVLAIIAICVKLTSRGPVLFRQERIGKGHLPFTIYKFRTMHVNAEEQGPSVTRSADRRLTKFGHLLRKSKLDELPQLFNVLRGDMSLVGPRPKLEKHERMQMHCKPGITGVATLVFAYEQVLLETVPEEHFEEFTINVLNVIKARLDTDYAKTSTFRSDIKILVATVVSSRRRTPITSLTGLMETHGHVLLSE